VSEGLARRPEPDPEVVALVAAALDALSVRRSSVPDVLDPAHRVWRFSGRWWNKPIPMRRDRPSF
jgi:hypothetical protein